MSIWISDKAETRCFSTGRFSIQYGKSCLAYCLMPMVTEAFFGAVASIYLGGVKRFYLIYICHRFEVVVLGENANIKSILKGTQKSAYYCYNGRFRSTLTG